MQEQNEVPREARPFLVRALAQQVENTVEGATDEEFARCIGFLMAALQSVTSAEQHEPPRKRLSLPVWQWDKRPRVDQAVRNSDGSFFLWARPQRKGRQYSEQCVLPAEDAARVRLECPDAWASLCRAIDKNTV